MWYRVEGRGQMFTVLPDMGSGIESCLVRVRVEGGDKVWGAGSRFSFPNLCCRRDWRALSLLARWSGSGFGVWG